jgi:hypothetical protein
MKTAVSALVFLLASQAVFAGTPGTQKSLYDGICVVINFGPNGENFKPLAEAEIHLQALQTVELYRDEKAIYSVLAHPNTYNNKEAVTMLLNIADAKTGKRLAASDTTWYVTGPTPPLMIGGIADPSSGYQTDIQCMQSP